MSYKRPVEKYDFNDAESRRILALEEERLFTLIKNAPPPVRRGSTRIIFDVPLEDMELTTRTFNVLMRSGIKSASEIAEHTEEEIRNLRNVGTKSMEEVRRKLKELGLSFRT